MISLFYPSEKTQWKKLENIIIKLQQRITKAALQGNYRKLRNLERLFLKSHSRQLKLVPQISLEQNFKKKFEFYRQKKNLKKAKYINKSSFSLVQDQDLFWKLSLDSFVNEIKKKSYYFLKCPNTMHKSKKLIFEKIKFDRKKNNLIEQDFAKTEKKKYKQKINLILKTRINKSFLKVLEAIKKLKKSFNFHFKTSSQISNQFSEIDKYLFRQLWNWLKIRYPRCSKFWIYQKYLKNKKIVF